MILAHGVHIVDANGQHHLVPLDDLAREILARIDGIRQTVVIEAESVDPPRVPAVASSPQDLSSLQRALVSDMERIAHGRPEHIQRDLAVIAAEVSAARSLDEIEACRQRALAYVEG